MTNRSFLNYRPCRLGNLAKFQPESNPYNASLVNLLLCHKAESPEGNPRQQCPKQRSAGDNGGKFTESHERPFDRERLNITVKLQL